MNAIDETTRALPDGAPGDADERAIDAARERLGRRIDEIGERVSPGRWAGRTMDYLKAHGGPLGERCAATVTANPLALATAALGVAWLAASTMKGPRRRAVGADAFDEAPPPGPRRVGVAFLDLMEDRPLVAGAVGAALGAAVGAALPITRAEQQRLAALRRSVLDSTRQVADEGAQALRDQAVRSFSELTDRLTGVAGTGKVPGATDGSR